MKRRSPTRPRINHLNPTPPKPFHIPRRHTHPLGARDCRSLAVRLTDHPTHIAAAGRNLGLRLGGRRVKGQHPPAKYLAKQLIHGRR